jgi:hypothetical protein
MKSALWKSPFACRMFSWTGCRRRQGSVMNSLHSALTAPRRPNRPKDAGEGETLNLAPARRMYSLSNWYKSQLSLADALDFLSGRPTS